MRSSGVEASESVDRDLLLMPVDVHDVAVLEVDLEAVLPLAVQVHDRSDCFEQANEMRLRTLELSISRDFTHPGGRLVAREGNGDDDERIPAIEWAAPLSFAVRVPDE